MTHAARNVQGWMKRPWTPALKSISAVRLRKNRKKVRDIVRNMHVSDIRCRCDKGHDDDSEAAESDSDSSGHSLCLTDSGESGSGSTCDALRSGLACHTAGLCEQLGAKVTTHC